MVVATLGTLVGVGGGFVIVPIISLLEPHWTPRVVTAFSLAVVMANAISGTIAYRRQGRVDIRSAATFALAAIPGVLVGVAVGNMLSRGIFERLFGGMLLALAFWLFFGKRKAGHGSGSTIRSLTDAADNIHTWSFDMRIGIAGSVVVGLFSALFGIGGGPINVPFLITMLNYPEHIATATSHGVLAITSLVAVIVHLVQGDYAHDALVLSATAAGAVVGAPLGARLSRYVPAVALVRALAVMLAIVAVEMLLR